MFHWKDLVLWSPIAASWLYMTRVVWARIVIERIWSCCFEVKGAVFVTILEKCEAPDIPRTSWDMVRSDMTVVHNSPPHSYADKDKNLPHGLTFLRRQRFWYY